MFQLRPFGTTSTDLKVSMAIKKRSIAARGAMACAVTATLFLAAAPPAHAVGPANDNFSSSEVLAVSGSLTRSNIGAGRESNEPITSCCSIEATVWFKWTAPTSGRVTFHTGNSAIDTIAAIYTGTSLAALQLVAADDDNFGCGASSFIQFNAVAGTSYSVQIGSWDPADTTSNLHLTWNWSDTPKSANDDVANAATLPATAANTITNADNSGSTAEPTSIAKEQLGESSTWYKVVATQPGQFNVSLSVSQNNNVYVNRPYVEADIWAGSPAKLIGVVSDGGTITLQSPGAQTFQIQMHSYLVCEGGAFTLTSSYQSGTVVTTLFTQPELDYMLTWALRLGKTQTEFAHDSVLAWSFVYAISGATPQPIGAPSAGTVALSSVWTPSELSTLDSLATGWQNTRGNTQRIGANALGFVLSLAP